jgi:hypothetical protein
MIRRDTGALIEPSLAPPQILPILWLFCGPSSLGITRIHNGQHMTVKRNHGVSDLWHEQLGALVFGFEPAFPVQFGRGAKNIFRQISRLAQQPGDSDKLVGLLQSVKKILGRLFQKSRLVFRLAPGSTGR